MILYKKDFVVIKTIKNDRGSYDIIRMTKRIFGKGYDTITLKENLSKEDCKSIKQQIGARDA